MAGGHDRACAEDRGRAPPSPVRTGRVLPDEDRADEEERVGVGVAQAVFLTLGVLFTIAAMMNALNRKAEAARKEVLGDL